MKRVSALTLAVVASVASTSRAMEKPEGNILVCVSAGASSAVRAAAEKLAADVRTCPVLRGLIETHRASKATLVSSEELLGKKAFRRAAHNHLVVVGLKSADPLVARTWGQYLSVDEEKKAVYMQGYGHLTGDVGYVESDRNPFLYSHKVRTSDHTTCLFRISGTTERGVLAGLEAFTGGLLNGLVAADTLVRHRGTVLDLDPSLTAPPLTLPASVTLRGGQAPYAGWTQVWESEYRAFIDLGGDEPRGMWRAKYLEPGALDGVSLRTWNAAFHRMAFGNAIGIAEFETDEQARTAAEKAGGRRGGKKIALAGRDAWVFDQPSDMTDKAHADEVYVTSVGNAVVMSSLTREATGKALQQMKPDPDRRVQASMVRLPEPEPEPEAAPARDEPGDRRIAKGDEAAPVVAEKQDDDHRTTAAPPASGSSVPVALVVGLGVALVVVAIVLSRRSGGSAKRRRR